MRRFVMFICVILMALGLLANPAAAHTDAEQFSLWATETYSLAVAPDGTVIEDTDEEFDPALGTRFFAVDTLYSDAERTEEVGSNRIECVLIRSEGDPEAETDFFVDLLCRGIVTLDDEGDLAWQTRATFTPDFDPEAPFATVALTGGTGAFVGASGEVALFDESAEDDPDEALTRYDVTLLP